MKKLNVKKSIRFEFAPPGLELGKQIEMIEEDVKDITNRLYELHILKDESDCVYEYLIYKDGKHDISIELPNEGAFEHFSLMFESIYTYVNYLNQ